ncbi:hypothetical protein INR49_021637, partial [Caranx melampygus]
SVSGSHTEATIPCTTSNISLTGFSLTWRFNHSQIILTQTRADVPCTVSEEWKQQVKGVSESGSLMLQHLSSHHEGTYTCELSDAEETLITNTVLRIDQQKSLQSVQLATCTTLPLSHCADSAKTLQQHRHVCLWSGSGKFSTLSVCNGKHQE